MQTEREIITLFKPFLAIEMIMQRIRETLESGVITQGPVNTQYEADLVKYFGYPSVVTVNSGTSGLTLALKLLNDDNSVVLCSPMTCFATTSAILARGMRLRWVDSDKNTCNMNLEDLKHKINSETRIILLVHWGGTCLDMDELHRIIFEKEHKYNIRINVIEDCAHAFGAEFGNKKLGTREYTHYPSTQETNICVYSTQAIKHLTTFDGGIMLVPEHLYDRSVLLRWYGIDRTKKILGDFRLENDIIESGFKYHMNDINSCAGLSNLPFMEGNIERNRYIAKQYDMTLQNLPGIQLLTKPDKCNSAYWLYTFLVNDKNMFIKFMLDKKIICSQVHKRNDKHTCVYKFREELPGATELSDKVVCVPIGWWITDDDMLYIIESIKEWSAKQK